MENITFQPGQKVWSRGNNFNKKPYEVIFEDPFNGTVTVSYEGVEYTSRKELFFLAEDK